jgi:hypothetical protein
MVKPVMHVNPIGDPSRDGGRRALKGPPPPLAWLVLFEGYDLSSFLEWENWT